MVSQRLWTPLEREEIFQAIGNPILILDPECTVLDANRAAVEAIGSSAEKMTGRKCHEIVRCAEENSESCPLRRMLLSGRSETAEIRFEVPDGVFLVSCTPILDGSGNLQHVIHVMTDITAMKRTEDEFRKHEEAADSQAHESQILSRIGRTLASSIHIEEIYERFSEEVQKLVPFDRIVINTISLEEQTVVNVYMAGQGISDREVGKIYPLQGSGNAEMVRTKSSLLLQTEDINDLKEHFPMLVSTFEAGFRSIMNIPLFLRGQLVGGLLLRSFKPNAYTNEHLILAEKVGNQIAGTIANARLYADLKHREKELQEALAKVETLRGLLPICASCKSIRNDKGYWTSVESFVMEHADVQFSHGICPECLKKLYPDFAPNGGEE